MRVFTLVMCVVVVVHKDSEVMVWAVIRTPGSPSPLPSTWGSHTHTHTETHRHTHRDTHTETHTHTHRITHTHTQTHTRLHTHTLKLWGSFLTLVFPFN